LSGGHSSQAAESVLPGDVEQHEYDAVTASACPGTEDGGCYSNTNRDGSWCSAVWCLPTDARETGSEDVVGSRVDDGGEAVTAGAQGPAINLKLSAGGHRFKSCPRYHVLRQPQGWRGFFISSWQLLASRRRWRGSTLTCERRQRHPRRWSRRSPSRRETNSDRREDPPPSSPRYPPGWRRLRPYVDMRPFVGTDTVRVGGADPSAHK